MSPLQSDQRSSQASVAFAVVTSLLGAVVVVVMLGSVVAFLIGTVPVPGDYVLSNLSWSLLAGAMAALALTAWPLSGRSPSNALHAVVFVAVPIAVASLVLTVRFDVRMLPLALAALVGVALTGRNLVPQRMVVVAVSVLVAFGLASLSVFGFVVDHFLRDDIQHYPAVLSPDRRLTANVTFVAEGAWGSDFEYVVVSAAGPHLLEQRRYVDDDSLGAKAIWVTPRSVRVGQTVLQVGF